MSLDGSNASTGTGLDLGGPGSKVCGLGIYGWPEAGLKLSGAGSSVTSSFIGTGFGGARHEHRQRDQRNRGQAPSVTVGRASAGNVIVGNAQAGVAVAADAGEGTVIAANRIGTGADGNQDPNDDGIVLAGDGTMVGGMTEGTGNFIVGNTSTGITVAGDAQRNPLLRNSVYNNEEVGINLGGIGFISASQDPLDVDGGANELQNAPNFQLTQGAMGNALYTQVYPGPRKRPQPDLSGRVLHEQRETLRDRLHRRPVDIQRTARHAVPRRGLCDHRRRRVRAQSFFDEPVKLPPTEPGKYLSGTATDSQGNTSNIGGCYEVIEIALPSARGRAHPRDQGRRRLVEVRCIDFQLPLRRLISASMRPAAPRASPRVYSRG